MKQINVLARIATAGLLALAVAAPAYSAQGMGRQGQRGQMTGQHGMVPGVQLSQSQRNRVAEIRASGEQQVQQIRRNQSLSTEQKAQRIAQIRQDTHQRVLNVLTPEQRRQFAQHYQERMSRVAGYRGGMGMSTMPGSVPGVNLTDEQQERIAGIRQALANQIQEIRNNQDLTAQQRDTRIAAARREAHEQVMNVLTPQQREQFNQWWQDRQRRMGS